MKEKLAYLKILFYSNLLLLIGIISSVWLIFWGWCNVKVYMVLGMILLFSNISVLINKYKKAE